MPASLWSEPRLALRVNMRREWIWELRSRDRHVVNRSDKGFPSWDACVADANRHGFELHTECAPARSGGLGKQPAPDARWSKTTME
jgi:hypothetical protein